jgi:peptidoglycan/LPS O-acetylase OafA/YrhL
MPEQLKPNNRNRIVANGLSLSAGESVNLDVLRSMAVLFVFAAHYIDISHNQGKQWSFLWHIAQLGVMIFFVHTCLVLMWSLERSELHGPHLFAPFYVRRALRIYPLSITLVLFAYIFDAKWVPANLWQNLTLTQYLSFRGTPEFPPTVTPLWTLPLEIEMYIVLPALFLIFRNRRFLHLLLLWIASISLASFQPRLGEGFVIFMFAPCFLGGVLAWRLMRMRNRQWLPGWMWPLAILAASLVWLPSNANNLPLCIAALGLVLGVAIPLFREIQSRAVATTARIIARYSYGIYLSHFPIMVYILMPRDPSRPIFRYIPPLPRIRHDGGPIDAVLVLLLTAGASYLLYHGIEERGIRLGRRMGNWLASAGRSRNRKSLVEAGS